MIKIGIIGFGRFGEAHAKAIADVPGLVLKAVCRTNQEKLKEFSSRYNVQGYRDYKELLQNQEIDAVVIVTPHHLHTEVATDAAKYGKHILIEKPMAPSTTECQQIIDASDQAGVTLMVGQTLRFNSICTYAKELIDSNKIGEVVMGSATLAKNWVDSERKPWHIKKNRHGGILKTVGIHYIDLMSYLYGSEVESVFASINSTFNNFETDDVVSLILKFKNKTEANIICTGYVQGERKMEAEIYCKGGILKIDVESGIYLKKNEGKILMKPIIYEEGMQDALCNEWKEFRDSILEKRTPSVSGKQGLHLMAVIEAAFKSNELKKEIFVNQN